MLYTETQHYTSTIIQLKKRNPAGAYRQMYTPLSWSLLPKRTACLFLIFIWLHQVLIAARRLNSCGQQAQLPSGMWDLLGPGIEPVSSAKTGDSLPLSHRRIHFLKIICFIDKSDLFTKLKVLSSSSLVCVQFVLMLWLYNNY